MRKAMAKSALWLLAGAEGVGKTRFAFKHISTISGSKSFVNLDEIARGLSPFDPELERVRAARFALQILRETLRSGDTGANSPTVETTLSGRTHLKTIEMAHAAGWPVQILYFAVKTPELALARIARRVSEGGRDVPEVDARRRFSRSIENLPAYLRACDFWRVYDHNSPNAITLAEGRQGCLAWRGDDWSGLPKGLPDLLETLPGCAEV
jgi:predicted ABC-type ATPase